MIALKRIVLDTKNFVTYIVTRYKIIFEHPFKLFCTFRSTCLISTSKGTNDPKSIVNIVTGS